MPGTEFANWGMAIEYAGKSTLVKSSSSSCLIDYSGARAVLIRENWGSLDSFFRPRFYDFPFIVLWIEVPRNICGDTSDRDR